jgi:hypothetical protein
MVDADGDGKVGYPTDPGCDSIADTSEADDCPSGPLCPDCGDGMDNDGDLLTDYPNDPGCLAASSLLEIGCSLETDPVATITAPVSMGTTAGAANNLTPMCATSSTAPDRVHMLSLPVAVATLTVNTNGSAYDTVLSVMNSTCGTTLGCNDDTIGLQSEVIQTNLAAGTYAIAVDGFLTSSGAYTLTVRGTVASGTACSHALFTAGVLTCTAPATCTAGMCQ